MGLLSIRGNFLPRLKFLHERGRVLPSFIDAVDCRWVNIVGHRRWVQLLQPIFEFLFYSEVHEVLETRPFLISVINRIRFLYSLRFDHWWSLRLLLVHYLL